MKQIEPGDDRCYDVAAGTELPAPGSGAAKERKGWCDDPWCYVDPCNCNAPSQYESTYFPLEGEKKLFYTYLTCGDADAYSGIEIESVAADGSKCLGDCFKKAMPSTDEVSGAESVKPILSTVGLFFLAATRW
jgi:hypothetical protein